MTFWFYTKQDTVYVIISNFIRITANENIEKGLLSENTGRTLAIQRAEFTLLNYVYCDV